MELTASKKQVKSSAFINFSYLGFTKEFFYFSFFAVKNIWHFP